MPSTTDTFTNIRRTRRNLMRAAGLLVGAVAAMPVATRSALADWRHHDGGGSACFLRGTRIRTSKGYRRIETLAKGDLLPTRFGGVSPVRNIDSFFVKKDDPVKVVRLMRSALDDNVPSADVVLTAPHAIYMDGILVSIGDLANGATIAFEEIEGEFFHIELEKHDVIEAEGAPCESLLTESMSRCAPRLAVDGGRNELRSRLRSAFAVLVDRRTPLDIVRDKIEERSLSL